MKKLISSIFIAFFLLLGFSSFAQDKADKLLGTYLIESPFSDDVARVKISKNKNGTYQGRIVWVSKPTNPDGTPRTDEKNPDPKLRTRKPEEIVMVWNLQFDGEEWVKGTIYDPFSGGKFGVKFKLAKNGSDMIARYYKGVPAMGMNATWKRVK